MWARERPKLEVMRVICGIAGGSDMYAEQEGETEEAGCSPREFAGLYTAFPSTHG